MNQFFMYASKNVLLFVCFIACTLCIVNKLIDIEIQLMEVEEKLYEMKTAIIVKEIISSKNKEIKNET